VRHRRQEHRSQNLASRRRVADHAEQFIYAPQIPHSTVAIAARIDGSGADGRLRGTEACRGRVLQAKNADLSAGWSGPIVFRSSFVGLGCAGQDLGIADSTAMVDKTAKAMR
jgi:hypothetical protein